MYQHYVAVQEFDWYFGLMGKETIFRIGGDEGYETEKAAVDAAIEFTKGLPRVTEVGILVVDGDNRRWVEYEAPITCSEDS